MESMADKIRRMAMRDEGISDEEMTELQGEKLIRQHLEEVAARDGGAAAIRAAVRPRKAKRPTLAQEEALGDRNVAGMLAADAARARVQGNPAGAAAQSLGASANYASPMTRRSAMSAPQQVSAPARPGAISAALRQPSAPPPSDEMMLQALAQQAESAPEEKQGMIAMLLNLLSGGRPAQQGGWQGPSSMQNVGASRIMPPLP